VTAHPTTWVVFVDRFGTPIDIETRCVIAIKTSKYGGAMLANGTITKIVPLVEAFGTWHSTGPKSRTPWWREDQLNKRHQTDYYPPQNIHGDVALPRAYVASVLVDDERRARTVPFGENLIVAA
jgi:hypothetical protein